MSTQPLQQAITSTRAVLAGVNKEQLSSSTPCKSWTVAQLIDHIVGVHYFFATMARGEAMKEGDAPKFSDGDFVAAFDEGSKSDLAAFSAEGAMERIMHLPFGDLPGAAFIGLAATDTFVHGWDLAKATGQATDLNPALAEALLAGARQAIPDAIRGEEGKAPFGPEQQAPAGASNADRLAAFLGRTV